MQRLDPQLKIPLLEFEPGQFLFLPLMKPFLLELLLLDLGALRPRRCRFGGEHLQGFLLVVETPLGLARAAG